SFVTIATLLPITIGGAGVREMGYVLLLGPHGVSQDSAIALGILQYSAFVGIALLGGGTVLLGRLGGPTEKPPVPPETPHSQAPPTPASPLPKAPPPTR
ncbi:MAG: flippase-like domain-containing protein, partial [Myxococcales bacterium]|nr:flippase-like domain-containing protein [Myxococcales bacterium]